MTGKNSAVRTVNNDFMHKIEEIRFLNEHTFILRFESKNLKFKAGQHISVGAADSLIQREYSIYSSENEKSLEILVREVLDGYVSVQLRDSKPGLNLLVYGPFGAFTLPASALYSRKFLFIATGTGIAPFHSFVTSYPGLDYTILHGIRHIEEEYGENDYNPDRYITCTSGDNKGSYSGRVTSFLEDYRIDPDTYCYLCGRSNMIYEVNAILRKRGVSAENIFTEIYF